MGVPEVSVLFGDLVFSLPVVGIGHHAHLTLDSSNLLLRGGLGAT